MQWDAAGGPSKPMQVSELRVSISPTLAGSEHDVVTRAEGKLRFSAPAAH